MSKTLLEAEIDNEAAKAWQEWEKSQLGDWRDVSHSESFYAGFESAQIEKLTSSVKEFEALTARLQSEAEIHAQEARTHRATVHEIYQIVTGKTGEPGNWNGAEPVRQRIKELEAERDRLNLLVFAPLGDNHHNAKACPYCNPSQDQPTDQRAAVVESDLCLCGHDADRHYTDESGKTVCEPDTCGCGCTKYVDQPTESVTDGTGDAATAFNKLSPNEKWDQWKKQKGYFVCPDCGSRCKPERCSPFPGTTMHCEDCGYELSRRTGGGQHNPFGWILVGADGTGEGE